MTLNFEYLYLKFRENREYLHLYNIIVINYCGVGTPSFMKGELSFPNSPKKVKGSDFPCRRERREKVEVSPLSSF